jgi:hypothetical protein
MRMVARLGGIALVLLWGCGEASICGVGSVEQAGTCIPVCVEACGEHEECVATNDSAQCECVAGYEGDPCVWGGTPRDPEFTDQEVWSDTTNGAVILPLAMGPTNQPGIAAFESSVVCNAGAVSQVVEMPSYEMAEPFVIEMTYRSMSTTGVAIGYGRAFRRVKDTNGLWATRRVCLGEAGYGGPVKFQVAASERTPDCFNSPVGTIEVDRFEILRAEAGECPAPGSALNGEGNVDEGGWFFESQVFPGEGVPEGALVAGVGESGSSAARVYKEAGGSNRAAMGTKISVPTQKTMPSPALRFWWRVTPGHDVHVELGTFQSINVSINGLDTLISDGSEKTYTYCLPPWTHGNVVELAFAQLRTDDFASEDGELVVDNVELVSDPKCGNNENLLDPSFDSATNRWPHARQGGTLGNGIQLLNDSERAHPPGAGILELTVGTNQATVAIGTRLWVPPSEGERGPQAVFYSNVPADAAGPVRWVLGFTGIVNSDLLPGGGWRRNEVCLPPEWAERWFRLGVSINNYAEPLETFDAPTRVLLDDFEITTSESCPAR